MKYVGYFFMLMGVLWGISIGKAAIRNFKYKSQSIVVPGEIVTYEEAGKGISDRRYHKVYNHIQYQREADSVAIAKVQCVSFVVEYTCGKEGEKRMVRFVSNSVPNKVKMHQYIPDYVQVTDNGDFVPFEFVWWEFLIPLGLLVMGFIFQKVDKIFSYK